MINHNQVPQQAVEPVAIPGDIPALTAQPFPSAPTPVMAEGWAALKYPYGEPAAQASTDSVVAESMQAGRPHVVNDPPERHTRILNQGKVGQIIDVSISIDAAPAEAIGKYRRLDQFQIMIKGKDGHLRPFSPPFFWNHNGTFTSDAAGEMGGGFRRPPNTPSSAVQPGEKALIEMRERIQRLKDKKIVDQAIYWYKVKAEK